MKAIEFTTTIIEGIIQVPKNVKPYNNSKVRVLILSEENETSTSSKESLLKAISDMENINMFSTIDSPTQWQKKLRNEWE